jgi:hypothetical protein
MSAGVGIGRVDFEIALIQVKVFGYQLANLD